MTRSLHEPVVILPMTDEELVTFVGEIERHLNADRIRVTFNLGVIRRLLTTALHYRRDARRAKQGLEPVAHDDL